MGLYAVCGLVVRSDVPLTELPLANGREAACTLNFADLEWSRPAPRRWFHHRRHPDGAAWLSIARCGSDFLLHFRNLADFLVQADGTRVCCYPRSGATPETIRHLFLDQVLPLVLSHRGELVLHASAVVCPQGAIAFIGVSGVGKSTLSASFTRQGCPLLADDCLRVQERAGQFFGIPSYPSLRLWDDAIRVLFGHQSEAPPVALYTTKKRMGVDRGARAFCPGAALLRRLYILAPGEHPARTKEVKVTPLRPREAFVELVKAAYKLDIEDRERLRREFECLGRMVAIPFLYRLAYPRDFAFLPAVQDAILQNLSED